MPSTSRQAYEETEDLRGQQREAVRSLLRAYPQGLTGPEVDRMLSGGRAGYSRRLYEMGREGEAEETGEKRRLNGTGQAARVFRLVDGWEPPSEYELELAKLRRAQAHVAKLRKKVNELAPEGQQELGL